MRAPLRFAGVTAALFVISLGDSGAAPLLAQSPDPQCGTLIGGSDPKPGGDACQRAVDLFGYITPQLGTLIAGGNAVLGQADVLGGLGRFSVGLRANVTGQFRVPEFDGQELDAGPVRRGTIQVNESAGGFPVLDGAIGLFGGVPLGITRAGGVDALVNVFYLPESLVSGMDDGDFSIGLPGGGLELGWGLRVGLAGETPVTPAVSFTYIRRGLPALDLVSSTVSGGAGPGTEYSDSLVLRGFSLQTSAWRIVAGKKLAILSVAAGYGQDRYSSEGRLSYVVDDDLIRAEGSLDIAPSARATNLFLDLSLSLAGFHIAGEIGRVRRSGIETFNEIATGSTNRASYAAVGIRVGH